MMKIGAGKIIGAALFAAGVAAIWLWPKAKVEAKEEGVVRPVRSMVVPVNYALLYRVRRTEDAAS